MSLLRQSIGHDSFFCRNLEKRFERWAKMVFDESRIGFVLMPSGWYRRKNTGELNSGVLMELREVDSFSP